MQSGGLAWVALKTVLGVAIKRTFVFVVCPVHVGMAGDIDRAQPFEVVAGHVFACLVFIMIISKELAVVLSVRTEKRQHGVSY